MSRPFQHRIKKQVEPSSGYGGWKPGMIMTHDFRDSDGDGIDDRKQSGPGVVPDWIKNRPPAPGGGKKIGVRDKSNPRRDRLEKALQDRKRRDLLTGRKRPPELGAGDIFRPGAGFPGGPPIKRPPMGGGGRPPRGGGWSPKPPRKGRTVKGSRPRPPMPSPKPPMFGDIGRPKPPRGGGRPPMFGGGRPKPPRGGRTVKGSRPRPPMPSPKPPGRVPITLGGIR